MASVSRDVSTFVIGVESDVELEVLLESGSRFGFYRDEGGELSREVSCSNNDDATRGRQFTSQHKEGLLGTRAHRSDLPLQQE